MEFKKGAEITTSEFWYDLIDGGYTKPEDLLKNKEDIKKVKEAIKVLKDFYDSADEQGIIDFI
jgi:hypothetical protein